MPRATSLAADIEARFGVQSTLEKGGAGVFDVRVDGELIFSKHAEGRFPEPAEVLGALEAHAAV